MVLPLLTHENGTATMLPRRIAPDPLYVGSVVMTSPQEGHALYHPRALYHSTNGTRPSIAKAVQNQLYLESRLPWPWPHPPHVTPLGVWPRWQSGPILFRECIHIGADGGIHCTSGELHALGCDPNLDRWEKASIPQTQKSFELFRVPFIGELWLMCGKRNET